MNLIIGINKDLILFKFLFFIIPTLIKLKLNRFILILFRWDAVSKEDYALNWQKHNENSNVQLSVEIVRLYTSNTHPVILCDYTMCKILFTSHTHTDTHTLSKIHFHKQFFL